MDMDPRLRRRLQHQHRLQRDLLWTGFLISQGGRCGICGSATADLCLDHDHTCCPGNGYSAWGRCYRGLPCQPCNLRLAGLDRLLGSGIGLTREHLIQHSVAIGYLHRY
jgi:hypothetical protein